MVVGVYGIMLPFWKFPLVSPFRCGEWAPCRSRIFFLIFTSFFFIMDFSLRVYKQTVKQLNAT